MADDPLAAPAASASAPPRVVLPRAAQQPPPHRFPFVAALAPVVVSAAIWAITGSAYALIFAVLGPVVAIAGMADGALQGRRSRRDERRRMAAETESAAAAIRRWHARERAGLERSHPSAGRILAMPEREPERWLGEPDALAVVVGRGTLSSRLRIEEPSGPESDDAGRLRALAGTLGDAPIVVDAGLGIGVCGPRILADGLARALVVQLMHAVPPGAVQLDASGDSGWRWLEALPHCRRLDPGPGARLEFRRHDAGSRSPSLALIAVAETEEALPRGCRVVLRVGDRGLARLIRHPDPPLHAEVVPELVSAEQARAFAAVLHRCARVEGLVPAAEEAGVVALRPLIERAAAPGRDSLACPVGLSGSEPRIVDLVADGPHALVGGTTGSGKSELLVSWLLSMAALHGPAELVLLLVDFKGGSSFAGLGRLPHSVGLITDLDAATAERALSSLRAELRRRERVLAEQGARAIEELHGLLPRLVVAVDEFAALVDGFPELHRLFEDLAARGRSLGIHVILCTQRPSGVVRDAIAANCSLRVALRMTHAADSVAVVGDPSAAAIDRAARGRGMLAAGGERPAAVRFALAAPDDPEWVAARWRGEPAPRRPWLDPLPPLIALEALPPASGAGIRFGLLDIPERQEQPAARYDPARQGSLLILGGRSSGRSQAIATLAASSPTIRVLVPELPAVWDALIEAAEGRGAPLLAIDDLDLLLQRCDDDYRPGLEELLGLVLRSGGRAGRGVIASVRSLAGLGPVARLFDSRLLLGQPSRDEHLLAGGDPAGFRRGLPAGGGLWEGHRVQVALASAPSGDPPAPSAVELRAGELRAGEQAAVAFVCRSPAALIRRLGHGHRVVELDAVGQTGQQWQDLERHDLQHPPDGRTAVLVGDPDAWHARWSLFGTVAGRMPVVFLDCSVADFRALTRRRALPPPLAEGQAWLLEPDGSVRRALLLA